MKTTDFIYVNPVYTGGGIYCYTGQLKNGNYFMATSESPAWAVEVTENPDNTEDPGNDPWHEEWIEPRKVRDIENYKEKKSFFKAMLSWIIKNEPKNSFTNYDIDDMERLLANIDNWCTDY